MLIRFLLTIVACLWFIASFADDPINKNPQPLLLNEAIKEAYSANPAVAAALAKVDAEQAAVRSQAFLDDPRIGFQHEANMNLMELSQGPMNLFSVSQGIKFPAKYVLLGRAQSAKARASEEMAKQKKLEIRSRVITGYYNLFAIERILALLTAQRESLREIARTAEARYATGNVPQQDEMKAHVEQTQLERDFLMVEEERLSTQATLHAALGRETYSLDKNIQENISLPKEELEPPKITADLIELPKTIEHHSKHIKEAQAVVEENDALKSLSYLSYAPDFTLNYKRAIGNYYNQNAYAASVEITFPLWFFTKQSGEVSSASARANEAQRRFETVRIDHIAEVHSLIAKVESNRKIIEVYRAGLIPQAESTLNSSRASYRAGRSSFIELLDSERSLYTVKIAYYRSLVQYAENTAKLEEILGQSISTLPFGDTL